MTDLKIGFAQFSPVLGNPGQNSKIIENLAPKFQGADIMVLPELCSSGYNFASKEAAMASSESLRQSHFIDSLVSLCEKYTLRLVAGINEREGDLLYNTAILVGPEGIEGTYRKMHLFWNEKDIFQPGNLGFPVFQVGECRVGLLICFDWIFPEAWRILALNDADLICHPSNLVIPGLAQRAVPIRAIENHVFVVTANRIGTEGDLHFTGCSTIADPGGEILAQGNPENTEVLIVSIDFLQSRNKQITPRNSVIEDRRPSEYGMLCSKKIKKQLTTS